MSLSQLIAQAELAHQQGQLNQAQTLYQQVLAQAPHTDALYGLATLYHQQGVYNQALPLFEQALTQEPNAFDINYNYLLSLLACHDHKRATSQLELTVALAPDDININTQLGQFALQLGLSELCLAITPDESAQGKLTRANAFIALEQYLEGYSVAKPLCQRYPEHVPLLQAFSICAAKLDKYDEAIEAYGKVVDASTQNSQLHLKYADLFLMAKQLIKAREQLDIAISLNDSTLMRFEIECKVCRLENDKENALIAANKALELKPEAEFAWQVLHDLGNAQDNQRCIEDLSALTRGNQVYSYDLQHNLYTLAKAQQKAQYFDAAFQSFNKANALQAQQFQSQGNVYDSQAQSKTFNYIKSINYPICQLNSENTENFFIVGMPRSGTTLVNRVLSQLENTQSCGESNAVATLFQNSLYKTKNKVEDIANWLEKNAQQHCDFYRKFNKMPIGAIVDKMPHNFRFVGAIISTFPQAKVIQMRRNPTDLALSIYSQFFNAQHNYSCDLEDIAHAIYHANNLMDHWVKLFPEQVIDVNYEDLAQTPQESFAELFERLGIAWQSSYLEFYRQNVASYTFSETQVRQPVNRSKIGFAKHYETQLNQFNRTYSELIERS
ncbi:sulfotransferase [Thalassotalea sp. LPB0316]|uniref:tetratricopeptide repeat-containing sulfotransferase family protein n=1 Tax=Thalassotalea sp. LPB0316 TaxID=2769490 RepID=UPI001866D477|nr:tetratricopeptide repeat-containing sulfotransferase family protein [Thalassotalea sp. LPB0316]QOL27157.1 sulfotransferase [Thalassotalea sp. LPB0316]